MTCGDVVVEPPFFLGPAIDEAAEKYEQADGAFVWFGHSALDAARYHRSYRPDVWETMVIPYNVPLKAGSFETIALNPFTDTANPDELARIRAGVERAMDRPGDRGVARKRENTLRFMEFAQERLRTE